MRTKISFKLNSVTFSFKGRRKLKTFLSALFTKEKTGLEQLDYIFCDDEYLLILNKEFLGHDYYTDVITFDLSESTSIKAEIYISIDRIKANAQKFEGSFTAELHRVIFHGALHLCGYKDIRVADKKLMTAKENYYLKKYFFVPRGT